MVRKHRWGVWLGVAAITLMLAKPALGILVDMAGHWAAPLVGALEARGIVSGNDQRRFNPDSFLTRAELTKLLAVGLGLEDEARLLSGYPSRFHDVPRWHWARGYIESLAETAIIEGFPDGSFAPAETVTRVQLAAILVRAFGLTEEARLVRFEPTAYADDQAVPAWGRGAVNVVRTAGIMSGFEDGTFRPLQPVTRAEGTVALFRLLAAKGRMFDLSGTLVRWDADTLEGVVRDELGGERSFTMTSSAQFFRRGLPAPPESVRLLDQIWIVLSEDGKGVFMDVRHADVLVKHLVISGASLTGSLPSGERQSYRVQPGTLVFVNGRPASLTQAAGAAVAYLALDRVSGEVRVLDAVHVAATGLFVSSNSAAQTLTVQTDGGLRTIPWVRELLVFLNGDRVSLLSLRPGDQVMLALDESGAVVYMQVER